ncbi:MAG: DUF1311 domain-containing protein [Alphaproteobacteria bacterium]|nr:MAG: DUF1311 domain-containing protein [Alphaproteobacteria bacterium]
MSPARPATALLALALAAWAGAAQAGERVRVIFDGGITGRCLEAAQDAAGRRACIGAAAEACMIDSRRGSTPPVMTACMGREAEWWQGRLDAARAALAERAPGDGRARLEAMSRAFDGWRAANCRFEAAGFDARTAPAAETSCWLRMTAEEALRLEGRLARRR